MQEEAMILFLFAIAVDCKSSQVVDELLPNCVRKNK